MTARTGHRLTAAGHGFVKPSPKCNLGVQVVMAGLQDTRVIGQNAMHTGKGHGCIALRVGTVLIYLEDRHALNSWMDVLNQAVQMQDECYGPQHPIDKHVPKRAVA